MTSIVWKDQESEVSLKSADEYLDEVLQLFFPDYVPSPTIQPTQEIQQEQPLMDDEGNPYPF